MNDSLQEIQPANGLAGNNTLTIKREASEHDILVDSRQNATNKVLQDEVQVNFTLIQNFQGNFCLISKIRTRFVFKL